MEGSTKTLGHQIRKRLCVALQDVDELCSVCGKGGGGAIGYPVRLELRGLCDDIVGSESQPSSFSFIKHRLSKVKKKRKKKRICRYRNAIVYLKKYVSIILFCILPQVENAHKNRRKETLPNTVSPKRVKLD